MMVMRVSHKTNIQIKFITTMLKSSLCDYSDAYIAVKRTKTVIGKGANDAVITADRTGKH